MTSLTKIPAGVQYFFDDDARLRRYVERKAMDVFSGWSYDEIILPMFDYHDLFARGMGVEQAEKTYRLVDRDGALLALRPELTSLVARTVATRFLKRGRPIRLCYSGEVFRYDEPTERAAREFHQLGIELVGHAGVAADLEVLLVAAESLGALGISDFRIALSHVDFFNGVAAHLQLEEAGRAELLELIDRRNSHALDEFLMRRAPQLEEARRRGFCDLTRVAGKHDALSKALDVLINERSRKAIEHLTRILSTLTELGLAEQFDIDLGDAGGLEYYTGVTFKIYVAQWGVAIGGGGRYDNLIGNFGAAEPAVGFSLSLDALTGTLARSNGKQEWRKGDGAKSITLDGNLADGFREARAERAQGRKVQIG
jgi:ATP phosphoribosyltransferase regulatory subunit